MCFKLLYFKVAPVAIFVDGLISLIRFVRFFYMSLSAVPSAISLMKVYISVCFSLLLEFAFFAVFLVCVQFVFWFLNDFRSFEFGLVAFFCINLKFILLTAAAVLYYSFGKAVWEIFFLALRFGGGGLLLLLKIWNLVLCFCDDVLLNSSFFDFSFFYEVMLYSLMLVLFRG